MTAFLRLAFNGTAQDVAHEGDLEVAMTEATKAIPPHALGLRFEMSADVRALIPQAAHAFRGIPIWVKDA